MALRLRKTKPTLWNGNGFGTSAAEWTLADYPGWSIYKSAGDWYARKGDLEVYAFHRKDLLAKLEPIVKATA
ncbi:hypothetical protein HOU03_gp287 [Caulobacter phage CcrSC]|uniref:Uncharacterized protein n=1 Tax=Caulobacter phage CcrSC TaxID=2283272 RepID=A0A385EDN6_9CAUD|nr:hypothetical protein HOU03_gp287 [Caulobacter phage CcrSC]AXQ69981.1 hypothetical protein CcrSC_gp399 [Caulobacter phage CcrSC]